MNVVLSIAGSDSGGGAGIQADIKSGTVHGVYMSTVLTAVTAQNTQGVQDIVFLEPRFIQTQIDSVLNDFDVDVIKIGMLGNKEIIKAVKASLEQYNIPIVLDPVSISRAGSKLLDDDSIEALKSLFSMSYLITPNAHESQQFFNISDYSDIDLLKSMPTNILFKNIRHSTNKCTDVLVLENGEKIEFESPKANDLNTHGTGCSYSASIASFLAQGIALPVAIRYAKEYIYQAISSAPNLGQGNGPINHMVSKNNKL